MAAENEVTPQRRLSRMSGIGYILMSFAVLTQLGHWLILFLPLLALLTLFYLLEIRFQSSWLCRLLNVITGSLLLGLGMTAVLCFPFQSEKDFTVVVESPVREIRIGKQACFHYRLRYQDFPGFYEEIVLAREVPDIEVSETLQLKLLLRQPFIGSATAKPIKIGRMALIRGASAINNSIELKTSGIGWSQIQNGSNSPY